MLSKSYPVSALCRVLKVSRSGYYEHLARHESRRVKHNRALTVQIRALFEESRQTYGAIRIHRDLQGLGINCSKNRVARLMKAMGIKSVHKQKYRVCTTDSKHNLPVAENIIAQDFSTKAPNEKWGCDITYIPTDEGWLYLAVVIDFYTRKIIGWEVDESMQAELCCKALKMALLRTKHPKQLIHHSDRGSQYASFLYRLMLKKENFTQSMSRKGNCYDNSLVESFFHTLKVECVHRQRYASRQDAKESISDYIENFYNSKRRHSGLDYLSPGDYERKYALAA